MSQFALILFDYDGCTAVVSSKKIHGGTVTKGKRLQFRIGRQNFLIEVLEVSDSKSNLNKFENEWSTTRRSIALDHEKQTREDGMDGGFLDVWPIDEAEDRSHCLNLPANNAGKKTGLNGREIHVLHDGDRYFSEENAVPQRDPVYFNDLTADQADIVIAAVDNASRNLNTASIQTDKVVVFGPNEDPREVFRPAVQKTKQVQTTLKQTSVGVQTCVPKTTTESQTTAVMQSSIGTQTDVADSDISMVSSTPLPQPSTSITGTCESKIESILNVVSVISNTKLEEVLQLLRVLHSYAQMGEAQNVVLRQLTTSNTSPIDLGNISLESLDLSLSPTAPSMSQACSTSAPSTGSTTVLVSTVPSMSVQSSAVDMSNPLSAAPSTSNPPSAAPSTSNPPSAEPSTSNPPSAAPSTSNPPSAEPSTSNPPSAAPSTSNPLSAAPSTSVTRSAASMSVHLAATSTTVSTSAASPTVQSSVPPSIVSTRVQPSVASTSVSTTAASPTVQSPATSMSVQLSTSSTSAPLSAADTSLQQAAANTSMLPSAPASRPLHPTTPVYLNLNQRGLMQKCKPGDLFEISSHEDMINIPVSAEVRVKPATQREIQSTTCSKGNFSWRLAQQIFAQEELIGKNFLGVKGKQPLSPRRSHAIEHSVVDTYGPEEGNLREMRAYINTGIRNQQHRTNRRRLPFTPIDNNVNH